VKLRERGMEARCGGSCSAWNNDQRAV
jgi:hypothetical protein